jgi:Flp pilus assembly pilin Flp
MWNVQLPREIPGSREGGQTLAEYALVLSLIAILAIVALMFLGGQVNAILSSIGNDL